MDTSYYTRISLSGFQKLFPMSACPEYYHFHLRERETEAEELVTCLVLPLWLNMNMEISKHTQKERD